MKMLPVSTGPPTNRRSAGSPGHRNADGPVTARRTSAKSSPLGGPHVTLKKWRRCMPAFKAAISWSTRRPIFRTAPR